MTYLVKALGACKAPVKPDVDAVWAANEIREVDDALYNYFRNRSVAFTILAGPGAAANLSATLTAADIPVGGDGATEFTALEDAPASITPTGVVVGNDDGTALRMSNIISINENGVFQIVENGASGVAITTDGTGGFSVGAHGDGGISLDAAPGPGGVTIDGGEAGVLIRCLEDVQVVIQGSADSGVAINASGAYGLSINVPASPGLAINGATAVASQSVLVAGVGTLEFTHGILTSFTPA